MSEKNSTLIGSRLREERERLELSQETLAGNCEVSRRTQVAWEKGEQFPNAEVLSQMATIGIDVLYVLTGVRGAIAQRQLSAEESALLDNYHHADEADQAAARRILTALAQQKRAA